MMRVDKRKFWIALTATLLAGAVVAILLAWAYRGRQIDWPKTLDNWEKATDTVEHITTSLALVVAGFWAYLQFVRRREDKPRLELTVTSKGIALGGDKHLLVTLQLRNTGSCDVDISQRGTGLEITLLKPVSSLVWNPPPVQDVFINHQWVEPGELISDHLLLEMPPREPLLLKLQLFLYSQKHHVRWESMAIVPTIEAANGLSPRKGGRHEPSTAAAKGAK